MPKTKTRPQRDRWEFKNPYWEIQGLITDDDDNEVWYPLYQYQPHEQLKARGALGRIIDLDDLPRELAHYEDFRLVPPDHGTEDRPEAPQRAVEYVVAVEADEPPSPPRKKKKRRKAPPT